MQMHTEPSSVLTCVLRAPKCAGQVEQTGWLRSECIRKRVCSVVFGDGGGPAHLESETPLADSFLEVSVPVMHIDTGRWREKDGSPKTTQGGAQFSISSPIPCALCLVRRHCLLDFILFLIIAWGIMADG